MGKIVVTMSLQLAAVALCFCVPVAAQKQAQGRRTQAPPPPRPLAGSAQPDTGKVVGSTYTNEYFGLQFTIPEGWRVADEDANRRIDEQGAEMIAGDSTEKRERLKEAAKKNINLLTIGKVITVNGAGESAILIVGAEAIPTWLINTPQEYMSQVRRVLRTSAMKIDIGEETRSEIVGGVNFAVIDVSSEQATGIVRQHYYATIRKGYALFIISTFTSSRSEQAIEEVLKTAKFK